MLDDVGTPVEEFHHCDSCGSQALGSRCELECQSYCRGLTMRGLRRCDGCESYEAYIGGDMCENVGCVLHSVAQSKMGRLWFGARCLVYLCLLLVDMCEMVR